MKIDYIIPTYNSASLLDKCLTAIKKYGNPNNIIIIDNFSKDKTIEIAKKYDCKIVQTKATLGECRLIGAENAETRWISFIDSDVIINETWKNIFKYINIKSAGAIQADPKDVGKDVSAFKCELPYNLKKLQRGFTGATVIRKDIIKDADIKDCNAFEDWFLTQHIIKKGYSWIVVPIIVDHYSSEEGLYYKKRMWHSSALRYYYKNKKINFFVFAYLFLRYFLWYLKTGEFKSMFYFLIGILKPEYFAMPRKSKNKNKENKISVCMITWNAERHLDESLNSVKDIADETVIIDRFSTDNTLNIAKKYNTKIYQKNLGFYESRKLAESYARGNWIFQLDADEVLSDGLRDEILDAVNNDNIDGIIFPSLYLVKNRFVRYPSYDIMQLFRKGKAVLLNNPVHEIYVLLSKNTITLKNPIYHFGWSINASLDKLKRYTDLEILRLEKEGYVFKWYHLLSKPLEAFFFYFVLKRGCRDGVRGLYLSIFKSFYHFIKVAKFWEDDKNEK